MAGMVCQDVRVRQILFAKVENPTTSKDLKNPKGSFWRRADLRLED